MLHLALFLLMTGAAIAQTTLPTAPAPGSPPGSYLLYAFAGLVTVALTTGGNLIVGLVNWRKNGVGNGNGVALSTETAKKIEANHKALHYKDEEGTTRPAFSGFRIQRMEAAQHETNQLLGQLVVGQTKTCELLENMQSRPLEEAEEEEDEVAAEG